MTEADGEKSSEKRIRGEGTDWEKIKWNNRGESRGEGRLLSVRMCHPRGGETGLR